MIAEGQSPFRLLDVKPRQPKKVAGVENFFDKQTIYGTCQFSAFSVTFPTRCAARSIDESPFAACTLLATCLG
jgi:hypothetical protein